MATLFTRIIRGEIPSQKLLEDDRFLAFLDIRPINPGHALVVPKLEVDQVFDLDPENLAAILPFAQRVAKALKAGLSCRRVGMLVAGFEVPHAHIHLVPIQGESELSFSRAKAAKPEELSAVAEIIRKHIR
jgi:histidine triad (HIT) family protein